MTEPSSFEEAVEDPAWVDAMVEEYDSIVRNSAWEIVPRPEGKSLVGLRWIYKVKQATDGSVEKYKARFVARGFSQIEGIDYEETFAPITRYSSIWMILAFLVQMGWHIHMDVKTAFLNEVIEEEVYIEQPKGFEIFSSDSHVCRLKRALYGLKQAPRAWYTWIDSYFTGLGFSKSEADPNLYKIVMEGKLLIIVLYVDDLILTGDELLILSCKEDLAREFEMRDLGLPNYFLGLEIWQDNDGLFVSHGKYAREILEKFNMHGCKPVDSPLPGGWRKEDATSTEVVDATIYRQLVGSLMYLVNTRPDICYAIKLLSKIYCCWHLPRATIPIGANVSVGIFIPPSVREISLFVCILGVSSEQKHSIRIMDHSMVVFHYQNFPHGLYLLAHFNKFTSLKVIFCHYISKIHF